MISPIDNHKPEPSSKINFMEPWFQNAAVSRAILALLRKLSNKFQELPEETTDMDWTAFRALAKAGAAEGIIRSTCTYENADGPCTEYFLVRGDYPDAMPSEPILTTKPYESVLVQARLTTRGIQWAEYLAAEKTQPLEKVRGFVLKLLWDAKAVSGSARKVPPPKNVERADEGIEVQQVEIETNHNGVEKKVEADEVSFGGPQEDMYDNRVVNWFGKRLYLGHDTQVSRLFWLLAEKPGVPHDLWAVQRAVDGMETDRHEQGEEAFRKSMNRIAKALAKLRKHLRENDLDDHVIIIKEGPSDWPSYTLIARFG